VQSYGFCGRALTYGGFCDIIYVIRGRRRDYER
jgi:hypothetical protein